MCVCMCILNMCTNTEAKGQCCRSSLAILHLIFWVRVPHWLVSELWGTIYLISPVLGLQTCCFAWIFFLHGLWCSGDRIQVFSSMWPEPPPRFLILLYIVSSQALPTIPFDSRIILLLYCWLFFNGCFIFLKVLLFL